ncbi:lysophospholipid acyltransferase family protein [Ectobacillus sp. JY-23]|uniref:lysophospholipid acyltransferase family protein n=1 Tax=Ectobacillus sp. JY-23 TaxID=2933872 RepID=UPI001FF443AC|nr:lysophospholipid acyltransferase family protein [Ectobacillus sp. JY-23]UOY92101.1 lysophospholipid acyltransferase family protein [Ectobacillus sp. JY-23]
MIPAAKQPWFQSIFQSITRRLLEKHFHSIFISKHSLKSPPSHALFILNHSSWWDGLVSFYLDRLLFGKSGYFMMHESGMKRYPYFRYLGAFSINRDNPKDILRSLQYGASCLSKAENVWMFPQGDERHLEIRPLGFMPGFLYIAEKQPHAPIVPICYYYSFGHHQKPELYISLGEPLNYSNIMGITRAEKAAEIEKICTKQLDELKKLVVSEAYDSFIPLEKWRWPE